MNREQLMQALSYRQAGFSGTATARLLNVERYVLKYALGSFRSAIRTSDLQLDDTVRAMLEQNPHGGHRFVQARLRVRGMFVSAKRVFESMRRVASETVQLRLARVLRRRQYSVPHVNFIWHIDGYHKLVRWKIVIHGAMDGYSRLCTYLVAAPSNSSVTALAAFLSGVATFGAPRHVRVDAGGENELTRRYVNYVRGANGTIVGRSVHNQRIERMWRDVFREVVCVYYATLRSLEAEGSINVNNAQQVARLHSFILPIINAALLEFLEAWNHHGLRTEQSRTPTQLAQLSRLHYANTDGCVDVDAHRTAAAWLLRTPELRDRLPARTAAVSDSSSADLLAWLRQAVA